MRLKSLARIPLSLALFFATLLHTQHSVAQDFHHMLSFESTVTTMGRLVLGKYSDEDKNDKFIHLSGSYSYSLLPELFLKVRPWYFYNKYNDGSSSTTIGSDLGLVINILGPNTKVAESFFISPMIGHAQEVNKTVSTRYGWDGSVSEEIYKRKYKYHMFYIEAGKRFAITDNFTYSPSIEFSSEKLEGRKAYIRKKINLIKFDIFI